MFLIKHYLGSEIGRIWWAEYAVHSSRVAELHVELYLLLLLFTAMELSLGGSSPYTSTDKTNKSKYKKG